MPAGRPTKYTDEMPAKVDEYLTTCVDTYTTFHKTQGQSSDSYERIKQVNLPSVVGLALYLGVNKTTLYEWAKQHEEFSNAFEKVLAEQEKRLLENGVSGEYNSTIAKLILSSNHGYAEKSETKNTHEIIVDEEAKERAKAMFDKM